MNEMTKRSFTWTENASAHDLKENCKINKWNLVNTFWCV